MNGNAVNPTIGSLQHKDPSVSASIPPTKKPLRSRRKKSNVLLQMSSTSLRLLLWSSILYVVFRCPTSADKLTDDSSVVCKQYVDLRSHIAPHIDPHYNTYLKPYVDKAQPHVDRLNEQFVTPASGFVIKNYNSYAGPQVTQAQRYIVTEWVGTVQPRLDAGQTWALNKYSQNLAPHVSKAIEFSRPYVAKAQSELYEVYDGTLVPLYGRAQPVLYQAYGQTHHLVADIVLPYLEKARTASSTLLAGKVWPTIVVLYGENVEPQIMRITQRLGRYRDSKKLEAAVESISLPSSITSAATSASSIPAAKSAESAMPTGSSATATLAASEAVVPTDEASVKEKIESDLKRWQEKFAKAADKGAEDLEERVSDITSRQIDVQAHGVGKALVVQLDETVNSSLRDLKVFINTSISKLPADAAESEEEHLYDSLLSSIKSSGEKIRTKAVAVRNWKQQYDNETTTLVTAALESTLDVIDNIRELGLQDIGMRWADMESVTYKDWSKYHALKKTFDEWRNGVEVVALQHKGLTQARGEGETVQDEAMRVAEKAARELIRLKDVAKWKVVARDASDDFSSKTIPAKAVKAADEILSRGTEEIDEALSRAASLVNGASEPSSSKPTDSVKSKVDEAMSSANSDASGLSASASSVISTVSDAVSSKASDLSESIATETPNVFGGAMAAFVDARQVVLDEPFESDWSDQISSMLEAAGDKASDLTSALSDALLKPTSTKGPVESATSLASEQYVKAMSAASSVLFGTPQPAVESISSVASEQFAAAVTAASYAIYGTPKPVLESLSSQAASAYGANAKQAQATLSSISSIASNQLARGLSQASTQYTRARIAVGLQPPSLHEQYLREAERRYYEGLGRAHEQYTHFVDVASSALYGTPTPFYQSVASEASRRVIGTPAPAYESLLSVATSKYNEVLSAASVKYAEVQASASSMAGMSKSSPAEKLLASAASQYDAAFTVASVALVNAASSASIAVYGTETGTFESAASAVSEAIVGKETPWNEAIASKASANFESVIAQASHKIYGSPTPVAYQAWSQANDYAAQATQVAASHYAAVHEIVSELLLGKEPDFTESVMSRFSSAYHTGPYVAAASASSYASAVYGSASSVASEAYDSASSAISSVFTPPAALEAIIDSASEQIQAAVDSASVQIYGTSKGSVEKAASAVRDTYNSAQAAASEAIYGKPPSPLEAAQKSFNDVAFNAQKAVSEAIYGAPTGNVEAASSSVASAYSQATSVVGENIAVAADAVKDTYESVVSQVSMAMYGPEQSTWESASSRIAEAAASASSSVAKMVQDAAEQASSAASAASSATARIKDEL